MKNSSSLLVLVLFFVACQQKAQTVVFKKYNETVALEKQQQHENRRMQFQLFQSKHIDLNDVFKPFEKELSTFSEANYEALKPLILEQDISSLQKSVVSGKLTYERLTLFYLYRIRKFESDSTLSLNSIISLNPKVLQQAREKDRNNAPGLLFDISVYGMPILLKDNINTKDMATTAGAFAMQYNDTNKDAFIVEKLKENGALILGKVNLSEWAYFFCSGCPLGYSAMGGQTLNPYGRAIFETGGSSAGSGVAVAANFAVAAVGTETSGSITSPSSLNSVVGLKPTVGTLSRTGIVPISSTLDTPGPMTKNVTDNYILLMAMLGVDKADATSINYEFDEDVEMDAPLKGKRVGVLKPLLTNTIYAKTVETMRKAGAELIEITPPEVSFDGFITLLNIEMKHDLPTYLSAQASKTVKISNVQSVLDFNKKDSLLRAPYGQQLFEGIVNDTTTLAALEVIKKRLQLEGKKYFNVLNTHNLDAILSINNYHSGMAAVANHPTLTVPMGYKESGEPISLTFIGKPFSELKLFALGYAFEQLTKARKMPNNFQ
jgi:amidase|tara:strand:+ start:100 stop:1743 length:1644 start_codon:yes stop_codon:yes gene_type:complete